MNIKRVSSHSDAPPELAMSKRRRRRLRTISVLPTLLTLGNLYFGFMAIGYCGREMYDVGTGQDAATVWTLRSQRMEALAPTHLAVAVLMLVGAMVCDALDGRVARLTGRESRFGHQMDSLADVVSFGAAPAMIMVTLVRRELLRASSAPLGFDRFVQAAVFIGGVYVCCAALRLARFTVETGLDEDSHRGFRGLPSPGAAGAVISLVLLHDHLESTVGWEFLAAYIVRALPFCTLATALLMVSRVPYTHMVGALLGRRPFGHVVLILLALPLLLLYTQQMLVLLAWAFVISGPGRLAYRRFRSRPAHSVALPAPPSSSDVSPPPSNQQAR